MAENYQLMLDKIIEEDLKGGEVKTLLLHACCAPCSSYCLEYLSKYYKITVFFYNPNITEKEEYDKRAIQIRKFIDEFNDNMKKAGTDNYPVDLIYGNYEPEKFFEMSKGLEHVKEGGSRCKKCYELRLLATAKKTQECDYDYFTTTLSISPHKNATWLVEIGDRLAKEYGLNYLYSDFKKRNGYKRSIELSNEYNLYRQNYCGCIYSRRESEEEG